MVERLSMSQQQNRKRVRQAVLEDILKDINDDGQITSIKTTNSEGEPKILVTKPSKSE